MPDNKILIRCRSCKTLNRVPEARLRNNPVCGQCKTVLEFPSSPINVTSTSYDQQVRDWPEVLVAEFWAKWCGHCRTIEPFVNSLAAKRAGKLKIIRVDVDSEPALSARFTIKATPTFILYRNGRQIDRFDGAPVQPIELEYWIDRTLQQDSAQG